MQHQMQQHIFNNKFIAKLMFSLLVTIAVSIVTVSAAADNNVRLQLVAGQSNPWALPQDRSQQYPENQADTRYPGYRFVTPEILESLKQQQIQNQQVPGNGSKYQYRPPQSMPPQSDLGQSMHDYYGYPPAGMDSLNPLYDAPLLSPLSHGMGHGTDLMQRGEPFPWLPDAATGGIPPMNVQPFTENNSTPEAENGFKQDNDNVFNPFTFGPNGNL